MILLHGCTLASEISAFYFLLTAFICGGCVGGWLWKSSAKIVCNSPPAMRAGFTITLVQYAAYLAPLISFSLWGEKGRGYNSIPITLVRMALQPFSLFEVSCSMNGLVLPGWGVWDTANSVLIWRCR